MVLDPDMLLQLAKKSAVMTQEAVGRGQGRGRGRGAGRGRGQQEKAQRSPYSHVDAWKSINGRPFARWIDPSVDVWDARFEGEGPSNADWLESPPLEAELDRAAGVMEVCMYANRHAFVVECLKSLFMSYFFGRCFQVSGKTITTCAISSAAHKSLRVSVYRCSKKRPSVRPSRCWCLPRLIVCST